MAAAACLDGGSVAVVGSSWKKKNDVPDFFVLPSSEPRKGRAHFVPIWNAPVCSGPNSHILCADATSRAKADERGRSLEPVPELREEEHPHHNLKLPSPTADAIMNAISTDSSVDPRHALIMSYVGGNTITQDRTRRALAMLSRSCAVARSTLPRCECNTCQTIDFMHTSSPIPVPLALLPSVFGMMFSPYHPWRTRGHVLDFVGADDNDATQDLAIRALAALPRTCSAARRALALCRCNACQTMEAFRTSSLLPPDALPTLHALHFPPRFRIAILGDAECELRHTRHLHQADRFLMDAYVQNGILTRKPGAYRPPYTNWGLGGSGEGSFGVFPAVMSTNRGPIRLEILHVETGTFDQNFDTNHSEWLTNF